LLVLVILGKEKEKEREGRKPGFHRKSWCECLMQNNNVYKSHIYYRILGLKKWEKRCPKKKRKVEQKETK